MSAKKQSASKELETNLNSPSNSKTELVAIEREIEKELIEANPEVFKGLNPKQKTQLVKTVTMVSVTKSHSGPLPAPEQLEHYSQIIDQGAERIMVMAENQSSHRIKMEDYAIKKQIGQSGRGQVFAFIIAITCIVSGGYLTMQGHDAVGGVLVGSSLLGLVVAFINGKKSQSKE